MKTKIIRTISLILLIVTFILIFRFSNQNGLKSSGVSHVVTEKIVEIFFKNTNITTSNLEYGIRKLAHFSIYTLSGIFSMVFFNTFSIKNKNKIISSLLLGIVYAATDEFHQYFIPGRSARITDICIDTCGVLFGIMIVFLVINIIEKNNNKAITK